VDTFFYDEDFGLRWEAECRVTVDGVEKVLGSAYEDSWNC
jgi:hypothetical protein